MVVPPTVLDPLRFSSFTSTRSEDLVEPFFTLKKKKKKKMEKKNSRDHSQPPHLQRKIMEAV